jgi:hypothetical protein
MVAAPTEAVIDSGFEIRYNKPRPKTGGMHHADHQ